MSALELTISANASKFNDAVDDMASKLRSSASQSVSSIQPIAGALQATQSELQKFVSKSVPLWQMEGESIRKVREELEKKELAEKKAKDKADKKNTGKPKGDLEHIKDYVSDKLGIKEGQGRPLAMAAGFTTLGATIMATAAKFDALDEAASQLGIGVEWLQKLDYAAKLSGTDIGSVNRSMGVFSSIVQDAAEGSEGAKDKLKKLGLTVKDVYGKSAEEQFSILIQKINAIGDAGTKAAVAKDIFGRGALPLMPLINDFDRLADQAERVGAVVGEDAVKSMAKFTEVTDACKLTLTAWAGQIVGSLATAMEATGKFIGTSSAGISQETVNIQLQIEKLAELRGKLKDQDEKDKVTTQIKRLVEVKDSPKRKKKILNPDYDPLYNPGAKSTIDASGADKELNAAKKLEDEIKAKQKAEADAAALKEAQAEKAAKAEEKRLKDENEAAKKNFDEWKRDMQEKRRIEEKAAKDAEERAKNIAAAEKNVADAVAASKEAEDKLAFDQKIKDLEASAESLNKTFEKTKESLGKLNLDIDKSVFSHKTKSGKRNKSSFEEKLRLFQETGFAGTMTKEELERMNALEKQREIGNASKEAANGVKKTTEDLKFGASMESAEKSADEKKNKIAEAKKKLEELKAKEEESKTPMPPSAAYPTGGTPKSSSFSSLFKSKGADDFLKGMSYENPDPLYDTLQYVDRANAKDRANSKGKELKMLPGESALAYMDRANAASRAVKASSSAASSAASGVASKNGEDILKKIQETLDKRLPSAA